MNKNISFVQPPAWAAGALAAAAITLSVSLPMGSTAFASESQAAPANDAGGATPPLVATGTAPTHAQHAADAAATDAADGAAADAAPAATEPASGSETPAADATENAAQASSAASGFAVDSASADTTAEHAAASDSSATEPTVPAGAPASGARAAEAIGTPAEPVAPSTAASALSPSDSANADTSAADDACASAAADAGATPLAALDADDASAAVEDGFYTIQSALNQGMVIDIADGSHDDEGNVDLYEANGTLAQSFQFESAGDGYYRIINVGSGKALDVQWGSSDDEANVWQYVSNGTDAQLWYIVTNDDGSYTFINKGSGKALDVQWGDAVDGTNVWQYLPNGSAAQRFYLAHSIGFVTVDDGTYVIQSNLNSQNVLDIASAKLSDETNVQAYTDNGTNAQRFDVQQGDDGWYTITSVQSGKALDVQWGSFDGGANVWQYESNGTDAQKWRFLQNEDGSLSLMNKASRYVLDLDGSDPGSNVMQYWYTGATSQRFALVSASYVPPIADGTYVIVSALDSSFAIDVASASADDYANVQIYKRNGTDAQAFTVTYDGDGWYTVTNVASGKCLDVYGAHAAPGTNVDQYTSNGTDAQKWRIVAQGDYFALVSKCSGMILGIDGSAENGANVQIDASTDALGQRFSFEPHASTHAVVPAEYGTLDGYDISSWQGDIDVASVPGQFVIVKATQGTSYVNNYLSKAGEALDAGKKIGLYHFATVGDAVAQAKHFVKTAKTYIGSAVMALDWEAGAVSQGVSWAKTWLDTVYSLTGVHPLIYMSKSVTTEYDWSSVASSYKLWVAQYPNYRSTGYQETPWRSDDDYGAWASGPTLFQYTSAGDLDGYDDELDLDKFYGTTADWDSLASQA